MDRFKYGWMLVAVLAVYSGQAQEFTMEQAVEHALKALKGNLSVNQADTGTGQDEHWRGPKLLLARVSLVSATTD